MDMPGLYNILDCFENKLIVCGSMSDAFHIDWLMTNISDMDFVVLKEDEDTVRQKINKLEWREKNSSAFGSRFCGRWKGIWVDIFCEDGPFTTEYITINNIKVRSVRSRVEVLRKIMEMFPAENTEAKYWKESKREKFAQILGKYEEKYGNEINNWDGSRE